MLVQNADRANDMPLLGLGTPSGSRTCMAPSDEKRCDMLSADVRDRAEAMRDGLKLFCPIVFGARAQFHRCEIAKPFNVDASTVQRISAAM